MKQALYNFFYGFRKAIALPFNIASGIAIATGLVLLFGINIALFPEDSLLDKIETFLDEYNTENENEEDLIEDEGESKECNSK